jgi:dTDP-4-dehydrorhamnose 3,5-epimerase
MIFTETKLSGAYVIEIEKIEDERGFFARTFDKNEFSKIGLDSEFIQSSISINNKRGTIRGMHYQNKPYEESKIVRCTKGKIFDVIIDLRPNSKTFKEWFSVELSEENHKMLYVPKGFAHGFQTLENNTKILYNISQFYHPESSKGVRWNDEIFRIKWPLKVSLISEKDLNYTSFSNQ